MTKFGGDQDMISASGSASDSFPVYKSTPLIVTRRQDSTERAEELAAKKWKASKAGQLQKKHPEWSDDICESVANHEIWIGMTLEMLKCERGIPNRANPSDYGSGRRWQWCWDNYNPHHFYGGDDGIITAYN